MNLYIYSDESGVFDQEHYEWYSYGGLVFFDGDTLQDCHNEYSSLEEIIRENRGIAPGSEMKAAILQNKDKRRLYQIVKRYLRFGALVHLPDVHERIFAEKKFKQRFLDYVYRNTILHVLSVLINSGRIKPEDITNVYFNMDGHTAPINSKYELGEAFEQLLVSGGFDYDWVRYTPAMFPNMRTIKIKFCDSRDFALVRAADIVANRVLHLAIKGDTPEESGLILYKYEFSKQQEAVER